MFAVNNYYGRFYILALLSAVLLSSCSIWEERYRDDDIVKFFSQNDLDVEIGYYTVMGRKMRYMSIGEDTLPTVLLIHGAPSSMSVFNELIADTDILQRAKVFAVDRPGYGFSNFGKTMKSIRKQAAMIAPILDSLHQANGPVVVMGVSYGGPVASRLAMDFPDLVDGLVLGAPAIAPGEEKTYLISYLITSEMTRWIFPTMLVVASEEKFSHEEELKKMLPLWEKVDKPIIYIQGEEDDLIYLSNAKFIEEKAVNAPFLKVVMIPDQPHFLAIPQKDLLAKSLIEMIDILKNGIPKALDYADENMEVIEWVD